MSHTCKNPSRSLEVFHRNTAQFSNFSKYRRKLSFYRKHRNYRWACHAWLGQCWNLPNHANFFPVPKHFQYTLSLTETMHPQKISIDKIMQIESLIYYVRMEHKNNQGQLHLHLFQPTFPLICCVNSFFAKVLYVGSHKFRAHWKVRTGWTWWVLHISLGSACNTLYMHIGLSER